MILVALSGCQRQFTRQRYETIFIGQSIQQVENKLGKPTQQTEDSWIYIREMPYYKAVIKVEDDKVVEKIWFDEREN